MPVGNLSFPEMMPIAGVQLSAVSAGIKRSTSDDKRLDLVLIELPVKANVAGVYTKNAYCAAPVSLCRQHAAYSSQSRYLIINSGNANACTGDLGIQAALATCRAVAHHADVDYKLILPFSTGVIGEALPVDKIEKSIPELFENLAENHWHLAARGIMTTDTCPKGVSTSLALDDCNDPLIINGIAKGSGMINPNMATMLAYIVTNACVDKQLLQDILIEAVNLSFNRITIDGDTSTNDSCLLMAAGTSAINIIDKNSPHYLTFKHSVVEILTELAQKIVRDGEGATKFVTIRVEEGASSAESLKVAYAIAHSPLVKTALFASDANWGRIVAAIGYAGIEGLNVDKVRVYLDDVLIVENGGRAPSYSEDAGQAVMLKDEILLRVCLGRGSISETIWTTDLSHEYITINAEYRT
ncbi:MAG: glutamate N-acetyltransferase/amino-acid N-acetyltransferase [Pseudohongiellaceae bacterium]|jgi:glutamate N-acetyltransferase/amino-acid N-acetyltransferase